MIEYIQIDIVKLISNQKFTNLCILMLYKHIIEDTYNTLGISNYFLYGIII